MEAHYRSFAGFAMSLCLLLATGCVAVRRTISDVPETLRTPQNQVMSIAAHGAGVQIYGCQATRQDSMAMAWTLLGPEAELTYMSGKKFGKHYAGPTWEAGDGSKVIGEVVAHENSPDGGAIPWLLIKAKTTSGAGIFAAVQSIQRLHTSGGKAPTTGCDANQAGQEIRIAYSADYYFYSAKP